MNRNVTSIYIPRLSIYATEEYVRSIIENCYIGKISRIDFTQIDKKPGFAVDTTEPFMKSAFIHFEYHYHNEKSCEIIETVCRGESYRLYLKDISYLAKTGEYWILLKAINPVKDTMMNNHQIVDNCRHLEKKIEDQEIKLSEQSKTIEKMSVMINIMNENIQRLYNLQQNYNQMMETEQKPTSSYDEKLKMYEKRYEVISSDEGLFIDFEDEDMSISSSSSSPSPTNSVEERIKMSSSLCGNE
jgi:uncharacterized coiled-coil protein SlyX